MLIKNIIIYKDRANITIVNKYESAYGLSIIIFRLYWIILKVNLAVGTLCSKYFAKYFDLLVKIIRNWTYP